MLPCHPTSLPHLAESLSSGLTLKVTFPGSLALTMPLPTTWGPGSSSGPGHLFLLHTHLYISLFNAWVPTRPWGPRGHMHGDSNNTEPSVLGRVLELLLCQGREGGGPRGLTGQLGGTQGLGRGCLPSVWI